MEKILLSGKFWKKERKLGKSPAVSTAASINYDDNVENLLLIGNVIATFCFEKKGKKKKETREHERVYSEYTARKDVY